MANGWVVAAGIGGFAGVGLGAASRHLTDGNVHSAEFMGTAAEYLILHSAALIGVGTLERAARSRLLTLAGVLFVAGMILFGGGLTALAWDEDFVLAWIVPLGGSLLLAGWLSLTAYGAWTTADKR